jgi:hypothetical protein
LSRLTCRLTLILSLKVLNLTYPLVPTNIAMGNDPFINGLPI